MLGFVSRGLSNFSSQDKSQLARVPGFYVQAYKDFLALWNDAEPALRCPEEREHGLLILDETSRPIFKTLLRG